MTRLFDDEQSSSLITSMMNPESNASKFIEQGEDIGLPRDVTMDILNKYATYGANTGIGNLGGERLVGYLNEEYRKQVDAPLQEMPKEAFIGGIIQALQNLGTTAVDSVKDVFGAVPEAKELTGEAADKGLAEIDKVSVTDAGEPILENYNAKLVDASGNPLLPEGSSRMERFQKFLEDNPKVAEGLLDLGKVAGREIGSALTRGDTKRKPSFRAPRPRFQPGRVRTQRIGMAEGGKPDEGSVLGRRLFIQGGEVDGPGGPKEDLVPIWASDSEYVVSEKGVRNMGGGDFEKGIAALDKINFGKRNV
jgi:hypothetical protein